MNMTDPRRGASGTILAARLVIFVTFLDLFIQFPIVAPYARRLGASSEMIGLIVGVYSATNLIGNLGTGVFLDRWGRKLPVVVGLVATIASLVGYAVVSTPEHLLIVRAVHGLATSVLTPGAFALIGDSAAVNRRARVMGVSGAIIAIAATIGPPFGGIASDRLGFGAPFLIGAALMAIITIAFATMARETVAKPAELEPPGDRTAGWLSLWTRPRLVTAYVGATALTIGLGTLVTHLPLALRAAGESASRTGVAFTVYAIVAMVMMAGPANRISDARGRHGPLAVGLVIIGLGMIVMALVPGLGAAFVGMGIFGFGFGLLFPPATALVVEATDRRERGAAFGIFYAVYSLGVVVGSLLSGILPGMMGETTPAPFVAGAAVAIAAAPIVLLLGRRAAHAAAAGLTS